MDETPRKTSLDSLKVNDSVDLERAARLGDEIGGYVMDGHVMAVIRISYIESSEFSRTAWFELPENLKPYVLTEDSAGLDDYSLTISEVSDSEFCMYLIPETLERTLLGSRKEGDLINIEIDPQTQAVVDTVMWVLAQETA